MFHAHQINPGTVGFYRIQYSTPMLDSLLPGIRNLTLLPVDRLGLQNDLFSLVSHQERLAVSGSVARLRGCGYESDKGVGAQSKGLGTGAR